MLQTKMFKAIYRASCWSHYRPREDCKEPSLPFT